MQALRDGVPHSKPVVDPRFFQALSSGIAKSPLFDNLRTLELTQTVPGGGVLQYARLFLGSSRLTQLNVVLHGAEITALSLLPYIRDMHPNLTQVELEADFESPGRVDSAVSELVSGWHHLTKLECGNLTSSALAHLSSLATLQELHVGIQDIAPIIVEPSRSATFPALRELTLNAPSLPHCTELLKLITSRVMEDLNLYPTSVDPPNLHQFLKTIQNFVSSTLQAVEVYGSETAIESIDPVKINILRPLFSFSDLTNIKIIADGGFDLDDDGIIELAMALPNLWHLDLVAEFNWPVVSRITLHGLISLVKYCPELHSLGIVVDATTFAISSDKPGGGAKCRDLHVVYFGNSRISDPPVVAAVLSDIFPNIEDIFAWDDDNLDDQHTDIEAREYQQRWRQVQTLLPTFLAVRKQEARFWKSSADDDSESDSSDTADAESSSEEEDAVDDSSSSGQ